MQAGVFDLTAGFEGTTEAGATLYHAPTTPQIAHDASASDVEERLETLPSLGQVCVLTMLVALSVHVRNTSGDMGCCSLYSAGVPPLNITHKENDPPPEEQPRRSPPRTIKVA